MGVVASVHCDAPLALRSYDGAPALEMLTPIRVQFDVVGCSTSAVFVEVNFSSWVLIPLAQLVLRALVLNPRMERASSPHWLSLYECCFA